MLRPVEPRGQPSADIRVRRLEGGLVLVEPLTPSAKEWLYDHLCVERLEQVPALVFENGRRLTAAMTADGLSVAAAPPRVDPWTP